MTALPQDHGGGGFWDSTTLVASRSISRLMAEMDLAAFSILSVLRISSRRLACAVGSSTNTTFDLSFTPAMSRNAVDSLSLLLYISFMSSGCSPVFADTAFFRSPDSHRRRRRAHLINFPPQQEKHEKDKEKVGGLTEGGLGADVDLVVHDPELDLHADGGHGSGREVGVGVAHLDEHAARPDLPLPSLLRRRRRLLDRTESRRRRRSSPSCPRPHFGP
ncbi:hypothetical protein B296_00058559 [Ensete ventricosum]|uniref:Uncharacterized protein n=1 Tax=Ensete ventricosum TaxID=4639 RepID=A0A426WYZ0_ENSVE|nr:hypothetical protein B296_00058559 [Ensete ventricosum]